MSDIQATFQFFLTIQLLGLIGWPYAYLLFKKLPDKGWAFGKIIGILLIGWIMWWASSLKLLPFSTQNVFLLGALVAIGAGYILYREYQKDSLTISKRTLTFIAIEELLFLLVLVTWTYFRGYSPDITGLEKYMDYGFMNSILRTDFMPPLDHFLARETINYYYFGHYLAAVITKLSSVPASFTYNLQMSLLFALSVMESFALGAALLYHYLKDEANRIPWRSWLAGILSAIFVTLIGNLHAAIYLFIEPDSYWYPDATRFIENTIHEFPIYSFIVNDLHAHVNNIPIVLTIITILFIYFTTSTERKISTVSKTTVNDTQQLLKQIWTDIQSEYKLLLPLAVLIGISYAVNAWDFAIYLLLSGIVIWMANTLRNNIHDTFLQNVLSAETLALTATYSLLLLGIAILSMILFWLTVHPISQGIGIVPLGEQSPPWQVAILWGVQVPLALFFVIWATRKEYFEQEGVISKTLHKIIRAIKPPYSSLSFDIPTYLVLLSFVSFFLIILPEIIFVRDIYPTHYRANTMFKFYYQAWIMLGIVCGVSMVMLWNYINKVKTSRVGFLYQLISIVLLCAGLVYPLKAVKQGLNGLSYHRSINGTEYIKTQLPDDFEAIQWMNENIKGQPTIVEAVGDSYTEYARVSANTGLPSVLGWPVHEWLWRGSYSEALKPTTKLQQETGEVDSVAQRVAEVKLLYETQDFNEAQAIIDKYDIEYIYVGGLEQKKYPELYTEKFHDLFGQPIYNQGEVQIYHT